MTRREKAVCNYEQHDVESAAEIHAEELALAKDVADLQKCEYMRLSQSVARRHSNLERLRVNADSQRARFQRELRATVPSCVTELADDLAMMRTRLAAGTDPYDSSSSSHVDYSRLPPNFGELLSNAARRVRELHDHPSPEKEIAAIRRQLNVRGGVAQRRTVTARVERDLAGVSER